LQLRGFARANLGEYEKAVEDFGTVLNIIRKCDKAEYAGTVLNIRQLEFYKKMALKYRARMYRRLSEYELADADEAALRALQADKQESTSNTHAKTSGQMKDSTTTPIASGKTTTALGPTAEIAQASNTEKHNPNQDSSAKTLKPSISIKPTRKATLPPAIQHNAQNTNQAPKKLISTDDATAISERLMRDFSREERRGIDEYTKLIALNPKDVDSRYDRGLAYLSLGDATKAVQDFKTYVSLCSWESRAAFSGAILCMLAYTGAHDRSAAQKLLQDAMQHMVKHVWPYPVLQFLNGEISEDEVLKGRSSVSEQTAARCYMGLSLLLNRKTDAGLKCLNWVHDHGDKQLDEYMLAVAELKRHRH
jgi:tetratricopeptide (TPR) repeat protein